MTISADDFISAAKTQHYDFYTGVPCSHLAPLINTAIARSDTSYVGAASEGEAIAIAAGAWLAGRESVVLFQNSGLGNTVNPLTSLNVPFKIPALLVASWRGKPGLPDEPQHSLMGSITHAMLDVMRIPHVDLPGSIQQTNSCLHDARRYNDSYQLPYGIIVSDADFEASPLDNQSISATTEGRYSRLEPRGTIPTRIEVLEQFLNIVDENTAVIATTGKCGRELFTLADREQHLYMVGAMGCAAPLGLGVAINSVASVVILDGDGAALMKLGALATIGAQQPSNLIHVILDNGVHDSTGGQATASVNFADVAIACGYRTAIECTDLNGFETAFRAASSGAGPTCIHVKILPGSLSKLGRPTLAPDLVARRFRSFLAKKASAS
ncbi:phosphonopyruvate decarboxylase [Rhizobium rhizogenes]|uniref:phosphonopyruvate decarboxylase n=1 Tax=Rhizobium rhizogenes TaxID=359 RepID=UPI0015745EDA|nr:phosphonopyruvate decarboxylase [Rhizobium rhizogenes]NTI24876.1 phosphonopyruvate decarboxylase [Rhizobium rhizogenes]QTG08595.1 phosphonopyruvate decarboxylase [Rhizobium rhizogenes]